jgi:uncharacterized lipoprotein YajG
MKLHHALTLATAALLLAACGDNPSDSPAAPPAASNEVPASATASATAYSQYAGSLAKSETEEPLDVRKVTPPTSETEAPLPI